MTPLSEPMLFIRSSNGRTTSISGKARASSSDATDGLAEPISSVAIGAELKKAACSCDSERHRNMASAQHWPTASATPCPFDCSPPSTLRTRPLDTKSSEITARNRVVNCPPNSARRARQ
eukprot:scaffold289103_cov35-Tisochrysis_lutea.AAC.4